MSWRAIPSFPRDFVGFLRSVIPEARHAVLVRAVTLQWALGAREAGHDAGIFLAGEATYLMKTPVADVLPVGMPPLRELIDEVVAQRVPVFV